MKEVSYRQELISAVGSLVQLVTQLVFASFQFRSVLRLKFKRPRIVVLAVSLMQLIVLLSGPLGTKRCEYMECATIVSAPRSKIVA